MNRLDHTRYQTESLEQARLRRELYKQGVSDEVLDIKELETRISIASGVLDENAEEDETEEGIS